MHRSYLAIAALVAVSLAILPHATTVHAAPQDSTPQASAPQAAQPQTTPQAATPSQHRSFPAPTNLQVLPKNLTGEQVHAIMEQWEGELGSGCRTCHAVDKTNVGPNGRPRLNFADDSKEEKQIARLMYKMTEKINTDYISMVPNSGQPVTCGTCHRGHLGPEEFVPVRHEENHDHPPATPASAAPAPGQ